MQLKTRTTHEFMEIATDSIQTTVFKGDNKEIREIVMNLIDVIDELETYITDKF